MSRIILKGKYIISVRKVASRMISSVSWNQAMKLYLRYFVKDNETFLFEFISFELCP